MFIQSFINDKLWHIPFNRVENQPEQLIRGREDVYFGYEFAIQGGNLPDDLIKYYIRLLSNPEALRGSLAFYRAWDATVAQNGEHAKSPLKMPVLAIGGERSYGAMVRRSDAEPRRRRAEPGHPRRRPLGRRGGSRRDAGGPDRVPGPVPRRVGRGPRP
jgi:hypothetical protein